MYETANRTELEKAQERFLAAERSMLEQRQSGGLAQALGDPLPGESSAELRWMILEDQHLAEEGLVELRRGEEVWFKHVNDLSLENRPYRVEAESARWAWLTQRLTKKAQGTGQRRL